MKKKIIERLIVFCIGLPALISLVVCLPQNNHLCLNLAGIVFSVLGAVELRNILTHKNLIISVPEAVILGAISPAAWTVVVSFGVAGNIVPGAFILGALWLMVSGVFTSKKKIDSYISRMAAGFAVMIYPGLFMAWVIQMAVLREAATVILVFFLLVLLNDAAAWLVGSLFGKNNKGIVAVSPNKSIAGFAGGLAASTLIAIGVGAFFPGPFASKLMQPIPACAILGLFTGAAAILGDLCESAIKRSAGVKDSGTLILGRGGALDTMDSLALAAPIFYLLYQVLFL
jgi:phosphatidate cytidylyltransferase